MGIFVEEMEGGGHELTVHHKLVETEEREKEVE